MNFHERTTASVLALAAAVLAPTIVLASAQAREAAPDAIDRVDAAGASAPVTHKVYVARPTNVGSSSVTDDQVLADVKAATDYWKVESDGRIAGFVLPTSRTDPTFATFETSLSAADVCGFTRWSLVEEAAAQFDDVNIDPFEGGTDLLVVVTPEGVDASEKCPPGSPAGFAPIGSGFHTGGAVLSRSTGALRASLAHEMGHTFGFGHSNIGAAEYRNIFNVMGTAIADASLPALSTAYRVGSGITTDGEVTTVAIPDATQSASFTGTLEPRSEGSGVRGLAVTPPDTRTTFYVDYRSGTGKDSGTAYANERPSDRYQFGPGVVVEELRNGGDGVGVSLLPFRLKTDSALGQAATGEGQTWTSPSGTVTVKVVSMSPQDGASVTVTYTPPSQSFSSGQVLVSGQHTFGSTLTATQSGFAPVPDQVEWQWLRNGSAIPDATGSSYTPTTSDIGQALSVRATAYKGGLLPTGVASTPVTVQPRVRAWTFPPTLTVTSPIEGQPVSVDYVYSGAVGVEHVQWYADNSALIGQTGKTYTPTAAQVGKALTAYVLVQAAGWSDLEKVTPASAAVAASTPASPPTSPATSPPTSPATSPPTSPATSPPTSPATSPPTSPTSTTTATPTTTPTPTTPSVGPDAFTGPKPVIKGRAVVGKRLRATVGSWPAGTTFTYRWLANGKVIRRATTATLTIKAALLGKRVSVRVTASKPGYDSVALMSARTRRVTD